MIFFFNFKNNGLCFQNLDLLPDFVCVVVVVVVHHPLSLRFKLLPCVVSWFIAACIPFTHLSIISSLG
jgi:hypothetical protein